MIAPPEDESHKVRHFGASMGNAVDLGVVVEDMEANGVCSWSILLVRAYGLLDPKNSDCQSRIRHL